MNWTPANFLTASFGYGALERAGYIYRGMGLYMTSRGSPKGRRPPRWCLVHLNSGHCITWISGRVSEAFPIASEIAECGDWDFSGLDGWRNQDPELGRKVKEILARYPKQTEKLGVRGDAKIAAQISAARA